MRFNNCSILFSNVSYMNISYSYTTIHAQSGFIFIQRSSNINSFKVLKPKRLNGTLVESVFMERWNKHFFTKMFFYAEDEHNYLVGCFF